MRKLLTCPMAQCTGDHCPDFFSEVALHYENALPRLPPLRPKLHYVGAMPNVGDTVWIELKQWEVANQGTITARTELCTKSLFSARKTISDQEHGRASNVLQGLRIGPLP